MHRVQFGRKILTCNKIMAISSSSVDDIERQEQPETDNSSGTARAQLLLFSYFVHIWLVDNVWPDIYIVYIVYIVVLLPFSPITMIIIISMWYWVHISVNHMPTQYFIIIIIYIFILQRRNNVHIVAAAVGRFRARGRAKLSVVCQIGWCILFEHAVCACVLMLNEKMDELPSSCVHWTRNTWVAKYFHIYTQ